MFNAISNWKYWCPKLLSVTRAKQKFKILGFCVCWWMLRNSFNWHRDGTELMTKKMIRNLHCLFLDWLSFHGECCGDMRLQYGASLWFKPASNIWFCVLLRYLYKDWVLRAEHMTCWDICGLNRPLKVWMIRTRVSWSQPAEDKAGGWNQCFVPDLTPKCLRSILRGKGGEGDTAGSALKSLHPEQIPYFLN